MHKKRISVLSRISLVLVLIAFNTSISPLAFAIDAGINDFANDDRFSLAYAIDQCSDCTVRIVNGRASTDDRGRRIRKMTIGVAYEGGPEISFNGHWHTAIAVRDDACVVVDYNPDFPGGDLVCYGMWDGKVKWRRGLRAIDAGNFSAYVSRRRVAVAGERVTVFGSETGGSFIEVFDLKTGRRLDWTDKGVPDNFKRLDVEKKG